MTHLGGKWGSSNLGAFELFCTKKTIKWESAADIIRVTQTREISETGMIT